MRTPKINARKLATALAPLALAGAVMAPTAAAGTPPSANSPAATAPAKVEFSKGFPIYNRISKPAPPQPPKVPDSQALRRCRRRDSNPRHADYDSYEATARKRCKSI
jgi:hypothetical protein